MAESEPLSRTRGVVDPWTTIDVKLDAGAKRLEVDVAWGREARVDDKGRRLWVQGCEQRERAPAHGTH